MNFRISKTLNHRVLLLFVLLLSACASGHQMGRGSSANEKTEDHRAMAAYREKVELLREDLAALNQQADLLEAGQVAQTAISYSDQLAEEYQLVRPAVLHNLLIRVGLKDRGVLKEGMRADINVFDPLTVSERQPELVHDFPNQAPRYIQKANGFKATIVNGTVSLLDGELTGNRAGQVLRHSA